MARPDTTGRGAPFTLDGWLGEKKISRSMYYKLKKADNAPEVFYIGTKVMITQEADEKWQNEQIRKSKKARRESVAGTAPP